MVEAATARRQVSALLGDYDWARALRTGAVAPSSFDIDFDDVAEASTRFKALVREGAYDCGELAIVTHLQALAYGKPLVLLPVVVLGNHHHKSIAAKRERLPLSPQDLAGKRVGVRTYSQTTGVWVRGILQHNYGVDPGQVTWVTFEEAHLAEHRDPQNCEPAPEGRKLIEMFLSGDLDAAILGLNMPDDPRVQPVIADPRQAAAAWQTEHHMVPINHMFVVTRDLCETRPDVVRELYELLAEARKTDTRFPLGLDDDWSGLDLISQYAFEQKVVPRRFSANELFADAARILKT